MLDRLAALSTGAKIALGVGVVAVVVGGFLGWQGVRTLLAWNSIERVEFDLADARGALPPTTAPEGGATTTTIADPVDYLTVLVIGSDARPEGETTIREPGIEFADAVALYLVPDDGSGPAIVSLPRDLIVTDPCTGTPTKLDRTLHGCGDEISGTQHVALAVEDLTGIGVDHFTAIRFDAVVEIVDSVGGVEICVDNALREGTIDLLPAGCSRIDGQQALTWIRSRQTQELVDGEWQFIEDAGDAARIRRQQQLLFALLDQLEGIRSPSQLAGLAEQLGDSIVLSDTLGIGDAVALAWDLRGGSIRTYTLPTEPGVLPDGSFALEPLATVRDLIEG